MADQTYETSGNAEGLGTWPPLLADNECSHGAMPHDKDIACICFGPLDRLELAEERGCGLLAIMAEEDAA